MASISQPPPPPKKSNVLLWVLVSVGGIFLLIAIAVVGGIAYIARNPTLVMTKMISAANPNVEVLAVDKGRNEIRLRDKQTGESYSISFDDARKGKFSAHDGAGRASLTIGGDANVPRWVPDYPGSDPQAAFSAQGHNGESGTFTFKTQDPPEKVTKFYLDQLQASGFEITSDVRGSSTSGSMLVAQDQAKRHTITAIVGHEGSRTTVAVTYVTNK